MLHYTYLHRCGNDIKRIFYVGKGSKTRYQSHNNRNKNWCDVVEKHGFIAEMVAPWPTAEEALEHEKFLIECFKDMGFVLCNMTKGGEGSFGWKHSEEAKKQIGIASIGRAPTIETRKKISVSKIGNKARCGYKNSDEHKNIIGNIWKGKNLSKEHRLKLSLSHKGKKLSEQTKLKMSQAQLKRRKNEQ